MKVSIGRGALKVATASANCAVGYGALEDNTSGGNNTALGNFATNVPPEVKILATDQAGDNITTGSNNTVVGYGADASSATVSNEITLGNASVTSLRIPGLQSGANGS